jgi:hypothetical protein
MTLLEGIGKFTSLFPYSFSQHNLINAGWLVNTFRKPSIFAKHFSGASSAMKYACKMPKSKQFKQI